MNKGIWLGVALIAAAGGSPAAEPVVELPAPQTAGGMPLMQALSHRQSTREFSGKALPLQTLSDLLWAAAGVNRANSGKRTAPSARDWREIEVYVATAEGAYRYDSRAHALRRVVARDVRALTGTQGFVATAPVNLVFVADHERMHGVSPADRDLYLGADTGFIAQNVYLYCASAGLATVVRGSVDRDALSKALGLGPQQQITLAQSVGYPKGAR
jgi:SagB-type dehydrogenase family enzyme